MRLKRDVMMPISFFLVAVVDQLLFCSEQYSGCFLLNKERSTFIEILPMNLTMSLKTRTLVDILCCCTVAPKNVVLISHLEAKTQENWVQVEKYQSYPLTKMT